MSACWIAQKRQSLHARGKAPISVSAGIHKLDFPLTTSLERLGPFSAQVAHLCQFSFKSQLEKAEPCLQ